jgi:cell division protein ZipA
MNVIRVVLLLTAMFIFIGIVWDISRKKNLTNFIKEKFKKKRGSLLSSSTLSEQQQPLRSQSNNLWTKQNHLNATRNMPATNTAYTSVSMTNRQLETIVPADPKIVKVNSNKADEYVSDLAMQRSTFNERQNYSQQDKIMAEEYHATSQPEYCHSTNNIDSSFAGGSNNNGQMYKSELSQQQYNQQVEKSARYAREFIISLSVISRMQRGFPGHKLLKALESAGLVFGDMNIFHYYDPNYAREMPLFSVSSAVEPGVFNLSELPSKFIDGVTLFMTVNACIDVNHAFDLMVRVAKQLSFTLNAELKDQNHKPLTIQTIERYKERVLLFAEEFECH